ncbi:hypothetical protein IFM89_008687 [Coptis chinensis]|uniref:Uncharacterized protein n=1 Tax=Coptis chinensis TaxID=261450 RepID=A0A835GXF2_9MAGN|nr:hypothetical protein IFM89_008687 [Coptis chinensis]
MTFVSALAAYAQLGFLLTGKSVNGFVIRMGFNTDLSLVNSLLNTYGKSRNGKTTEALGLFNEMVEKRVEFNSVTVEGVFFNAKQQSVIGLVASGMGRHSGVIPETTVGKLSTLQTLDLRNNKIKSLSSDFWSLGTSLKYLNLSCNQISRSVPSNIGNFGALERLVLSFNSLYGEIPTSISSLLSLQRLY